MTVAELTRDLVSIPSHEDETEAGDFVEQWLRENTDGDVTRDDAGNVIARKGEGDQSLALVGHHDVVNPDESQIEDGEYVVETRDGRIYSRGAADMKGAVAASMLAFRDADPSCELIFASFVGEEVGGTGARAAIDEGFAPDFAIVGEGSTGYSTDGVTDVVVAHKGRRGSTITAAGEAAHASEVALGENAIYRASDAVNIVRDLDFPTAEILGHSMTGSVAVTEIEGGSGWNVIPASCTVTIDERTVPGGYAPLEQVEAIEGVSWAVDQDLPPMACDDAEFADIVLRAAENAQNVGPKQVTKPHATDAVWLAQAGTSCVICGAAEQGEAHTKDESVSIDTLETCEAIYREVAETL